MTPAQASADPAATSVPRAGGTAAALRFTGVGKRFDTGTQALTEVDLTVAPGEFVSVVGPSGCGKSTLLRLASGLSLPTAGRIELSTDKIAYVFQDPTLLPWRSALGNVELVTELHRLPKQRRRERALRALGTVGLTGFEQQLPAHLSGGMRMRVSLARALVLEPDLFLFDEPFGALVEITRLNMQEELQRLVHGGTFSTLFITHSVSEAVFLSNRVLVMSARPGRIVAEIEVPFDYPRAPDLRFDPAFGRIAAGVSEALTGAHR
ncbi:MAG: NitT/TauT family transport system ATP-binding protein [Pseudonocardiales bacterium]|nr:NitT/TauT family transport system ATP-binding protein [Pseudonocardiales bacterium]